MIFKLSPVKFSYSTHFFQSIWVLSCIKFHGIDSISVVIVLQMTIILTIAWTISTINFNGSYEISMNTGSSVDEGISSQGSGVESISSDLKADLTYVRGV